VFRCATKKPLYEISVGDILILLEGQLFKCEKPSKDNLIDQVLYDQVWEILDSKIRRVVTEKKLDELVDETKKRENKQAHMYYI
jgi:DNA-binding IscR family transcriptional regulator